MYSSYPDTSVFDVASLLPILSSHHCLMMCPKKLSCHWRIVFKSVPCAPAASPSSPSMISVASFAKTKFHLRSTYLSTLWRLSKCHIRTTEPTIRNSIKLVDVSFSWLLRLNSTFFISPKTVFLLFDSLLYIRLWSLFSSLLTRLLRYQKASILAVSRYHYWKSNSSVVAYFCCSAVSRFLILENMCVVSKCCYTGKR